MIINEHKIIEHPERYIGRTLYTAIFDKRTDTYSMLQSQSFYIANIIIIDEDILGKKKVEKYIDSFWVVDYRGCIIRKRNYLNSLYSTNYRELQKWIKNQYREAHEYHKKIAEEALSLSKQKMTIFNSLSGFIPKEDSRYEYVREKRKKIKTA